METTPLKNSVVFETGMYSRGLIGLGYGRHIYSKTGIVRFSFGTGVGFGLGSKSTPGFFTFPQTVGNLKIYLNAQISIGTGNWKFCTGAQPKVVLRESNTNTFYKKTVAIGTYFGLNYIGPFGFTLEFRLGVDSHFKLDSFIYNNFIPTTGISIGRSF